MNGKVLVGVILVLSLVLLSSGCLQENECSKLENELAKKNLTCKCAPSDVLPKEFKNRTDVEPKCFCVCKIGGEWQNITIVQAKGSSETKIIPSK